MTEPMDDVTTTEDLEGEEPEGDPEPIPTARWLIPLVAVLGVVGLVAVALARGPITFDPTTPEGAVQEYLLAISQERWDDAVAILDPESFGSCGGEDISAMGQQAFTAAHESTDVTDSTAVVAVTLQFGEGDVFGTAWEQYEQFTLIDRDGFWYISQDPWPYFRWSCEPL
jgi:hypothetical protein